MLIRVEVHTPRGGFLALPLSDASGGYILEEIEGLDPVKATLVSTSFANMDGEQYHSSRREARNMKITLGLDPGDTGQSVSQLRGRLYQYFMPKSSVLLKFVTSDGLVTEIRGRVETMETPMFAEEPAVAISLMCFDPDFVNPNMVQVHGNTTPSTTDNLGRVTIDYRGTVDTGIVVTLKVNRSVNALTFYHDPPTSSFRQMDFQYSLLAGDVLTITTTPGEKSVNLTRGDLTTSALFGMSPESAWSQLEPGANFFRFYAEGAAIPYTIEYMTRYGGL